MKSWRVAFEWRSRCQLTLPNPSPLAAGLSCRDSNVRRSSAVPFPLGKTKAPDQTGLWHAWPQEAKAQADLMGSDEYFACSSARRSAVRRPFLPRGARQSAPALRVDLNLPPGFALDEINSALALSPNGEKLAFVASGPMRMTTLPIW